MNTIYDKVFGANHGKNLWDLSLEDIKLLSKARQPERERRHAKNQRIKNKNNHLSKK
jgi:hypothetical protein